MTQKKSPTTHVPPEHHASDFLANERTFLAWIRTSVAVISLGFAVAKFDAWLRQMQHLNGSAPAQPGWSQPMGIAMIVLGGLLPILAAWRYHVVNRQIERGEVRADRILIFWITGLILALAVGFVLYLLKTR